MKLGLYLVLAGTLLFGSSVVAFGDNVRTDYDHQANFSQYHTYSWGKVKTSDPFYVGRIQQAVNSQLQAKGWQLVPSGGSVTIFASDNLHNQQQTQTMYDNMGGGWGTGWGAGWGWGGWGWGRSWDWSGDDDHDKSVRVEPGDRPVRWEHQEAAVERPGD